jgi:hypothetical protein
MPWTEAHLYRFIVYSVAGLLSGRPAYAAHHDAIVMMLYHEGIAATGYQVAQWVNPLHEEFMNVMWTEHCDPGTYHYLLNKAGVPFCHHEAIRNYIMAYREHRGGSDVPFPVGFYFDPWVPLPEEESDEDSDEESDEESDAESDGGICA